MKALDIALKDLSRSLRNAFFLVFGFALPLLTAALFHFAFGGMTSGDGDLNLPATEVLVVNQDQALAGFSAGQLIADVLQGEDLDIVHATEASDAARARSAVDMQEAAVAVIIPADFTAAILEAEGQSVVEIYQDPTLTLGPNIVRGIVSQLVDGLSGSKIATSVASEQLSARGVAVDAALMQGIAMQYADWSAGLGEGQQGRAGPFLDIQSLAAEEESMSGIVSMIGLVMAGMMVFYVFFTGAAAAQSILQEEDAGTLPRLFTTPTSQSSILGGKFVYTFLLLTVQVVVLVVASSLLFGIDWGDPLPVALVTLGLVVLASSFGIFITSLLKDTRQAGIVYGGVMTVLGMIGMVSVFTANVPGASNPMKTASLFVPQGWGVRGWELLLQGGGVSELALTVVVMLAAGAVFFAIGLVRFRKRFA